MTPENYQNGPERILSRERILSELQRRCESFEVVRELSDEKGIYFLEVKAADNSKLYIYQRERLLPGQPQGIESARTTIRSEDLDDSYSRTLADYDPKTGEWVDQ